MAYADRQERLNAKALRRFGAMHQVDGADVQGDFVRPGKTFTLGDGMPLQSRVPLLVVADGDVPAAPVGKTAVCEGESHRIEEARPDGHGLTVLEMKKVQ